MRGSIIRTGHTRCLFLSGVEFEDYVLDDVRPEIVYLYGELNETGRETEIIWETVENPLW